MSISMTNTSLTTSILVDPSSRSSKRQRSQQRFVSFNSMAEVYDIETISPSNTCDEEENDLWWRSCDYKTIKDECLSTARRKMASDTEMECDDDPDCECRGLERLINSKITRSLVNNSIRAVMREQTRQRLDGEDSDLSLAELYEVYSRHSAIRARRLGMSDAKQARALMRMDWQERSCEMEQENEQQQQQQNLSSASDSREPDSSKRRSSSRRHPLQEHIKIALTNIVTRRHRAWI